LISVGAAGNFRVAMGLLPRASCAASRTWCRSRGSAWRLTTGAEAGHRHSHVGARRGKIQPLADEFRLHGLAPPFEAVEQAAQRPHIVGVNLGTRQRAAQAEIVAINDLCFRRTALLQQQRTKRMADRLHPSPTVRRRAGRRPA
jgi:hypothetical protein